MGKNHPHLYVLLKNQSDTEIAMVELSMGRRIKVAPRKKWLDVQKRLRRIVQNYEDYETLAYWNAVGQTVII